MRSLVGDLRFAGRLLRRTPGFTTVSILTLGAAIGGCTAIYSIVYGLILEPLPYPKPQQIVQLAQIDVLGRRNPNFSDPNFEDLRDQTTSFQAMAAFNQYGFSSIVVGNVPLRVRVANVSDGFLDVMGIEPALGRRFAADESREGGPLAVLVSQRFWHEHFSDASDLSNAELKLNGDLHSVVGVMPAGFVFPPDVDIWRPLPTRNPFRTAHNSRVIARLRDNVGIATAQADASVVATRLKAKFGQDTMMSDAAVLRLHEQMVGNVRPALLVLLGSVGLLLVVACANLANVLLARATARRRELAIRAALGATSLEIVLPLVAESLIVSACGGALGIASAAALVRSTALIDAADLPHLGNIRLSWPVLIFAIGITWLTALALSLLAAWRERRPDVVSSLKDTQRGHTAGGSVGRLRNGLVVAQLVVSVVLIVGASLLGRSLIALLQEQLGFRTTGIVAIEMVSPPPRMHITAQEGMQFDDLSALARQARLNQQIIARLSQMPGAIDVGGSNVMPLATIGANGTFAVLERNDPRANVRSVADLSALMKDRSIKGEAEFRVASEGYFRVMGIPLLRGRLFDERDAADAPHVAVISETFAHTRLPDRDPIGQQIQFGGMDGDLRMFTVVGIVGDVRERGFDVAPRPVFYANFRQRPVQSFGFTFVVSTAVPGAIMADARRVIRELAPEVPPQFRTIGEIVDRSIAGRRFTVMLAVLFAGAALLVAVLGIYGVTTFLVAMRSPEIGLRLALGAQTRDVHRLVLAEAGRLITIGVSGGLIVAYAASRALTSQLFGVRATDPVTYIAAAATLAVVAILACEVPALRAMRVDPARVLRGDG
jgi:predicted permease